MKKLIIFSAMLKCVSEKKQYDLSENDYKRDEKDSFKNNSDIVAGSRRV
jgi:hypothetical protein